MSSFQLLSLLTAIVGGVGMNVAMKYSSHLNPFVAYTIAYAVAMVICLIVALGQIQSVNTISTYSWLALTGLGVSFVVLNVGYLWLYSSGLSVAYIPVAVTAGMTIVLSLIAVLVFGEQLSWQLICGVILILAGMIVMSMK